MDTATLPAATPLPLDLSRIAQDLQIRKIHVEAVVQLLDEGNTVPFITRYRKERTGGLTEEAVRRIRHRVGQLRHLADRKQTILKSIDAQGKLTDDLRNAVLTAETPKRLEDLYLPYKPKKRSPAAEAREKGLEPLALALWTRDPAVSNLAEVVPGMVNPEKQLNTVEDVTQGVGHILAEVVAETANVRGAVRHVLWDTGRLTSAKSESLPEGKGLEYKDYFQFTEPVRHVPPHRVLAMNRGEKENALKVKLEFDGDAVRRVTEEVLRNEGSVSLADHPHLDALRPIIEDALNRILLSNLEREVRRELTERAQDHAIIVFARNLQSLLLQPPLSGKRVLAIDPGFRTGCRLAALDESGKLMEDAVIFPHQPQKKLAEGKAKLEELVRRHQTPVIAIGNGTACRETEELVAALIQELDARRRGEIPAPPPPPETPAAPPPQPVAEAASQSPAAEEPGLAMSSVSADHVDPSTTSPAVIADLLSTAPPLTPAAEVPVPLAAPEPPPPLPGPETAAAPVPPPPPLPPLPDAPEDLAYVIVNEAGASDYSASPIAKEEFPNFDATLRGTVSIGRRLQDPLSELVKIDPQHVGVGLYQHDVHPKHLKESLEEVIESCVNHVGVDLNTAGVALLRHVSGVNQLVARDIVEYRQKHGAFANREQLKQVPSVNESRYRQAAGFLKVAGDNPLDVTWIHPEDYPAAQQLLGELGFEANVLREVGPGHPLHERLRTVVPAEAAQRLNVGEPTVLDILDAFARPGFDPRDEMPPPIFKRGLLRLEDMTPGMELKGTVLNVVDFGAFVDVGLKDSGLVHISQMANRYIKSPHEVVAVGDVVKVWVLSVDADRRRVSLTMIAPGTERRPPERRPQQAPRGEGQRHGPPPGGEHQRGGRPPRRGRRPVPAQHAQTATAAIAEQPASQPPQPRRPLPVRRPPKPKPLPTLTKAKREGKEYLTTLGELEAFFKAREDPQPPPAPQ
jgi:uncharacterized protein